jgi:PAS domain S-box-containing protein
VVTSNPAVIFTSKPRADRSDYDVTYMSNSVVSMLGFKPEELIGHPEFWDSRVHPDDLRHYLVEVPHLWKDGQHTFEYRFLHKDGTYRWIREETKVVRDGDGKPIEIIGYWTDITERWKMDNALRKSEERFRRLLESMSEHIAVFDTEWRYLLANEALTRSVKIPREHLLGRKVTDIFPGIEKSAFFEAGGRVMNSRRPASITTEHTFEDGQTAWFETHIYPVPEGIMYVANDISGRKLAEAALRESEEHFRGIVNGSLAGYFFIDRDGRFQSVNDAWLHMHGYASRDEVIGKHYSLTQIETDLKEADNAVETLLSGTPISSREFSRRKKNGSIGYHLYSASPAVREGRVVGLEGFLIDITERKELEQRLLKSERMATIGELAAMVGHDLRNPLTGIATAIYNLRTHLGRRIDGETRETLDIVEQDIQHSDKIITDLLEYSRETHLDLRETDAKSITKDALAHTKIPAKIRIVDSTHNHPKILVDAEKMRRVFINLINNAVDAMPKRGTLKIASRKSDGNLEITLADTGTGMTRETIDKLWSPLFTTKAKGMGFGLPIAKRLVEAHEGSISVESKARKGSTFTVTLPIRSSSESKTVRDKK